MTDKTIKCSNYSKCGQEGNFTPIKGSNNTKLCHKCGGDICFICGKKWNKEENFRWVEDYDCCGNKIMVKVYYGMFSQSEKDENHPEGNLTVYYCDEHREIGEKSPNKWTKEDQERLEKEKKQGEWEIAEKLNSQKGLFYCQDDYAHTYEGKQIIKGINYGCFEFWGRENGKSFYLMVPDTHPVLNDFKYQKKVERDGAEVELTAYNLKEKFFLIEGIEKLSLEATRDGSYNGNDPLIQAQHFSKVVGLNDKITITPIDSQGKPEKNKPNNENISVILNSIKEYFQKNDIKSIKLVGDKWIVEYNHNQKNNEYLVSTTSTSEFQELKNYFQATNKNEITLAELNANTNSTNPSQNQPDNKILIGCIFGGIGLLIIGVAIAFIFKKKKVKKT